jgi:hypothetical protein
MTYSAGSTILASDYDNFRLDVNSTWNYYWGQTALSGVSAGSTVTAAQWSTLASTITSAYLHQTATNPSVASPSAGQNISIIANLSTAVAYIKANPYYAGASGSPTSADSTAGAKGSTNAAWSATWTQTITMTDVPYYYSCGARIFISFAKTSTGTLMDPTWNALVASCSQISFTVTSASKVIAGTTYQGTNKQGGDGTPTTLATNIGFQQLTGTYQTIFLQYYPTYPYTGSYIQVLAKYSGFPGTLSFETNWVQPASGYAFEPVNISAGGVTTITQYPPSTTYISNSWGTPTLGSSVT